MEVREKVVIVTGDTPGIGRALCRRFAREGARATVVADVDEAGAKAVTEEVQGRAVISDVRLSACIQWAVPIISPLTLKCCMPAINIFTDIYGPPKHAVRIHGCTMQLKVVCI
jgi:NAD(P)-dependent dehydrogenase (short-subunit alcohol dehydrogenase family)